MSTQGLEYKPSYAPITDAYSAVSRVIPTGLDWSIFRQETEGGHHYDALRQLAELKIGVLVDNTALGGLICNRFTPPLPETREKSWDYLNRRGDYVPGMSMSPIVVVPSPHSGPIGISSISNPNSPSQESDGRIFLDLASILNQAGEGDEYRRKVAGKISDTVVAGLIDIASTRVPVPSKNQIALHGIASFPVDQVDIMASSLLMWSVINIKPSLLALAAGAAASTTLYKLGKGFTKRVESSVLTEVSIYPFVIPQGAQKFHERLQVALHLAPFAVALNDETNRNHK